MRSRKKILKERLKNKRIRKEKARLRNRTKKHKRREYVIMTINGLELETLTKLRLMAKQRHTSLQKLISKLLSKQMKEQLCLKEE